MEKFDCGGKLGHINGGLSQAFPCFPIVAVNTCTIRGEPITNEKFGKACNSITIYYNILQSLHFNNVQF